jgi:hypothetical protein
MGKLSDRRKEKCIRQLKEEVEIYKAAGFSANEDISRMLKYVQLADAISLSSDVRNIGMLILICLAFILAAIII